MNDTTGIEILSIEQLSGVRGGASEVDSTTTPAVSQAAPLRVNKLVTITDLLEIVGRVYVAPELLQWPPVRETTPSNVKAAR